MEPTQDPHDRTDEHDDLDELDELDEPDAVSPAVERSVALDATVDEVLAALDDPELLSAWLGAWSDDLDGRGGAAVVTDDGIVRRVADRRSGVTTRSWTWRPTDAPDEASTVTFTVRDDGGLTVLTVREDRVGVRAAASAVAAGAAATAPSVPWLRQLLALGAVLALGAPVRV